MISDLSITLAQINPIVGDLEHNFEKIKTQWSVVKSDLIVFPELVTSGYPPEDLVLKPSFIDTIRRRVEKLALDSKNFQAAAILPTPWLYQDDVYNAALLIYDGQIKGLTFKHNLPNYGVFDEKRVFKAGPLPSPLLFKGLKLGIMICEDMWSPECALNLNAHHADILIVPNGSPFSTRKIHTRMELAKARVAETGLPLLYVNQIGGQDELVFDGGSFILDETGAVKAQLKYFEEDTLTLTRNDINGDLVHGSAPISSDDIYADLSLIYDALVIGVRDYVQKNGFKGVLIGLSGGIDSALTAQLAVDAIGPENVECVMMPSEFTAKESLEDAQTIADTLGVDYSILPINEVVKAFKGVIPDLTGLSHENIQSRIRGTILMAKSNQSGKMLLTTGNKSEMAMGYATLYGDMNGGFNALKDVYKTQVYALTRWRNENRTAICLGPEGASIPDNVLTRAPSAELRADQKDEDSLPPYPVLDEILRLSIEEEKDVDDIVNAGFDTEIVIRILTLLDRAEYKRYQSPPGTKITPKAFGRDRRYPMTNGFSKDYK